MEGGGNRTSRDSFLNRMRRPSTVDGILLLTISALVTLLCFHGSSLVVVGDFGTVPLHPALMAGGYLSPWSFWTDTGSAIPFIISNQVPPIDFLFYLITEQIGLSALAAEQVYAVVFSYFLGAYATYLLVRILFETEQDSRRLAALVAGVFYILNPTYVYSSGTVSVLGSSIPRAALPLALVLLVAGFKKRDLRYALGLGLESVLLFSVFARAMEAGFFFVIAAALALPYARRVLKVRGFLKFAGTFFAISILVAFVVNLFWIVPFLGNYGTFSSFLSSFQPGFAFFESQFTTLANVFRLQGYWPFYVGTYVPYASYFSQPAVVFATFALPVFVVAALAESGNWEPGRISMALLLVLFLGLAMGTNLPLNLYESLITQVPFFKLFKDPWVFLEPLALVYSVLIGLSFERLAGFLKRHVRPQVPTKAVSFAIALVLLGTISGPVLTGAASTNSYDPAQRGVAVPADYTDLGAWLETHGCDCATLLVPQILGDYLSTNWGYQGTSVFYRNLLPGRLITGSGSFYDLQSEAAARFLNYVYMLLSFGDPTYSPIPLNDTLHPWTWTVWSSAPSGTWSVNTSSARTPWNTTSLEWAFGYPPGGFGDWYTAFYTPISALDLSGMHWVDVWLNSSLDLGNFVIEIQDREGTMGLYAPGQHVLIQSGPWALVGLPLGQPDSGRFNQSSVSRITLDYVAPPRGATPVTPPGIVTLGALELSSGRVSPRLIQNLLGELNVRYVLLDNSINNEVYRAEDPQPYAQSLANLSNMPEVARFGNLTVYKTGDAGALVSIPSSWTEVSDLYSLPSQLKDGGFGSATPAFLLNESAVGTQFPSHAQVVRVDRTSPTDFSVAIDGQGEFLLVLATSYDSDWQATVNGQAIRSHVVADGYANGWLINYTGNVTVSIAYSTQPAFDAGIATSVAFILGTFVVLVVGPRRLRGIGRRLRERLRNPSG